MAGAGAGGAAAYGLSNKDASGQAPQQASSAAAGHPGGQGYPTSAGASTAPAGQTGSQQHHYGRDAALAGGAGAAGVSAYELGKNRQDDGTSPDTSRLHERNVAGVDPSTQREAEDLKPGQEKQHHYGRDAAVAGGAGAAGAGAYELAKDKKEPSKHTGPHDTTVANASDSRVQSQPEQLKSVNKPNEPSMAGQDPQQQQQQHHYGRDAAVAGGAGVAGAGAYEALKDRDQVPSNMAKGGDPTVDASKHPAETWDPNRIAQKQKEIKNEQQGEPTDKAAEKAAKEQKEQKSGGRIFSSHDDKEDKKAAKQQEKAEKEHEKEEKKAAKQQEKIAKEERKEEEKAAKQHKKDQEEEEKEKKPGLISRILHPGRKSGEGEEERGSREGTPESSRLSADHRGSGDNRVSEDERGHHKLHKKSVEQQQQHGNGGDGRVTEPHTGLPMNTEKYGSGAGGTDGSQQIEGYQAQGTGSGIGPAEGEQQGVAGPDWNAIKKANTPY